MKRKYEHIEEYIECWKEFISLDDLNKLSRDYWNNPLKRGEAPNRKDFEYLYTDLNLPLNCMYEYFNLNIIGKYARIFGLHKTKEQHQQNIERLNLKKYGVKNTTQIPQIRQKVTDTCVKKYGVTNAAKLDWVKDKMKQTMLDTYGVENAMHSEKIKQKLYDTNMEKFGCKICTQNEEIKQKLRDAVPTMLKNMEHTNMERYGVKQVLQLESVRDLGKQTCLEKYGVEYASQSNEIQQKVYITKKHNGTIASSSHEQYIKEQLEKVFGKENVIHQYRSVQYPFMCDFYVKPLDLYIEYQGYWKHGYEPFDKNNPKHLEIIEYWEQKSKELNYKGEFKQDYSNAIHVWTEKDVLKRHYTKDNNLNWVEFFNLEQFDKWIHNLNGVK